MYGVTQLLQTTMNCKCNLNNNNYKSDDTNTLSSKVHRNERDRQSRNLYSTVLVFFKDMDGYANAI